MGDNTPKSRSTPTNTATLPDNPFNAVPSKSAPINPTTGPLKSGYVPVMPEVAGTPSAVSTNSTSIFPPFDLQRRALPSYTREILERRAELYGRSKSNNTYLEGLSHAAVDGMYFKLRGETVRCKPKYGGFLELPNDKTNPDTVDKLYSARFTPPITVEQVTLTVGISGQYGAVWNMAGTIVVYTPDDLEMVEENFLIPGNKIMLSAGHKKGFAPHSEQASNFQLPNNWESNDAIKDYALRVVGYTFAYDNGKWICSFTAVGIEDLFLHLKIPYTIEARGIKYTDGFGTSHLAEGIGQTLYFSDAVGKEQTALSCSDNGKVIKGTFTNFFPVGNDKRGEIIPFDEGYWHNQHYVLTGDNGTLYDDPIRTTYGIRLYFTFDYILNRIINDLILRGLLTDTGFLEKNMEKLLVDHKWWIKFDDDTSASGEIPPESELPFLSADPSKVICLGRANYKNSDGLGTDFTEVVKAKNGSSFPQAVAGDLVDLRHILIHGSVIETALRQSQGDKQEYTIKGSSDKKKTLVITMTDFLEIICNTIRDCTGGFVSPKLVQDPILDTIASGGYITSLIINTAASNAKSYEVVEFDPIKGDGSTRALNITGAQGSQAFQSGLLARNTTLGDGEIGGFLTGCDEEQAPAQAQKKSDILAKIQRIKERLGAQLFIGPDINDAVATWHQFYNYRATNLDKSKAMDQGGKLYLYPGLNMSATIHGTWGFKMGMLISNTAVPNAYRIGGSDSFNGVGIPFMIRQVTHKLDFTRNDWSTQLDAFLCFPPDPIQKVDLRAKVQG